MKRRNFQRKNLDNHYADALERLEEAEAKLTRAFNAWIKARRDVRGLGKKLDALQLLEGT
jgi:hypothetical protein